MFQEEDTGRWLAVDKDFKPSKDNFSSPDKKIKSKQSLKKLEVY